MTEPGTGAGRPPVQNAGESAPVAGGWRTVRPELLMTATMVIATAVAAYAYAGGTTALATVAIWAVVIMVLLRILLPVTKAEAASQDDSWQVRTQGSYLGFWRKRGVLVDASTNMRSYDADLRPMLQHLLAARLAERHGVSLYADPEAARRLLLDGEPDDKLWYWLDPERPPEQRSMRQGIPQRTLSAIVERLERL